ncbi:hypothetical protein HZH66_013399 [Vespula vulgaris]|uniref:Uncharacterized protein n=1 Tax=Vespula vulgaris TaxID=7454 RepID=A0A834MRT3_VESVU|nr:hypothetical protein HZH66_013399 [Vespula vulgaris]
MRFGKEKSDEKSLIVSIEDTSSPQVLLSRIPMIFLITRPLAIINLELQSICLGYLPKEAYRGCAMELMGPFVFPRFGH